MLYSTWILNYTIYTLPNWGLWGILPSYRGALELQSSLAKFNLISSMTQKIIISANAKFFPVKFWQLKLDMGALQIFALDHTSPTGDPECTTHINTGIHVITINKLTSSLARSLLNDILASYRCMRGSWCEQTVTELLIKVNSVRHKRWCQQYVSANDRHLCLECLTASVLPLRLSTETSQESFTPLNQSV